MNEWMLWLALWRVSVSIEILTLLRQWKVRKKFKCLLVTAINMASCQGAWLAVCSISNIDNYLHEQQLLIIILHVWIISCAICQMNFKKNWNALLRDDDEIKIDDDWIWWKKMTMPSFLGSAYLPLTEESFTKPYWWMAALVYISRDLKINLVNAP